jgi:hypothetical protein
MSGARPFHFTWLHAFFVGCSAVAVSLCWAAWSEHVAHQRAEAKLRAAAGERDRVGARSPQPSVETVAQIEAELAEVRRAAKSLESSLAGQWRESPDEPAAKKSVDAYFELAAFVEKNRALAAAARTLLAERERFGFAAYQTEGPPEELLPAVDRQRKALGPLLKALFESAPQALLAVQRERPSAPAQRAARAAYPAAGETAPQDYFAIDPALSLHAAGAVDTMAFRLEFTGRTASLRSFLNAVAASRLPFHVRSVEVDSLAGADTRRAEPGDVADAIHVPLVAPGVSKFAVVVELVELVRQPTGA